MIVQVMDLARWSGIRLVSGASGKYSTVTGAPFFSSARCREEHRIDLQSCVLPWL